MNSVSFFIKITLLLFIGMINPAFSATIGTLFNTGVDANGVVLPHATIGDPHYSLVQVAGNTTSEIRSISSAGGFPIIPGLYIADNDLSRWIGPNNGDGDLTGDIGDYKYRTTFDLTGFDFTTANIQGRWAADNEGLDILINGVSLGFSVPDYSNFANFSINSGFIAGLNTLEFLVRNIPPGGPTALRVEFTVKEAAISEVPLPAAMWLFGSVLVSLIGLGRKPKNI